MFSSKNERLALMVAAILFAISAIGHIWRILGNVPATFNGEIVPIWYSVFAGIAALAMAVWMGIILKNRRPII
jgi:hypothetical protein